MSNKTHGVSSKLSAGALAGALVAVLIWVITAPEVGLEWVIPPEVSAALVVILSAVIGWLVPEGATTDSG